MNAENLRQTALIQLGSPSATASVAALFANTDLLVKKVTIINGGVIAASNSAYWVIQLLNGAAVVASIDTRAAAQNGLASLVGKGGAVNPNADGSNLVAAGSTLTVTSTITGAPGALTGAVLQVEYVRNKNN